MWFLRRDKNQEDKKEDEVAGQQWAVPDDFPTIQEALDASSDGDTIVVRRGRYQENIDLSGRDVHLTSCDPQDPEVVKETVLDGQSKGPVVQFASGESSACRLSGFTITNGYCPMTRGIGGGGVAISGGATPLLELNIITENRSELDGGGISVDDGWPTIINNTLVGNRACGSGGGIHLSRDAASEDRGETAPQTPAESFAGYLDGVTPGKIDMGEASGEGGHSVPAEMGDAESLEDGQQGPRSVIIEGNHFVHNSAWAGGAMAAADQLAIVRGNTFEQNRASRGGAVNLWDNTEVLFIRNNVIDNEASVEGGGIMVEWGSAPVIDSNRFTGNRSDRGAAISIAESTAVQLSGNFIETGSLSEAEVLHMWQRDAVTMHKNRLS